MILAQINSIGKTTPIEPGSHKDFRSTTNGIKNAKVENSTKGGRAEKGKVILRVTPLNEVDLNEILEVIIIGSNPLKAKLISHKKTFLKGQEMELYFDQVFQNGFKESISNILYSGGGLIGFSSHEKEKMVTREMQKKIYDILVDFMMINHIDSIKDLAIPALNLKVADNKSESNSHLCGIPKFGFQKSQPLNSNGSPLFHLGTLMSSDFASTLKEYSEYEILTRLSFYIDIKETENGWPVERERYKVINYLSAEHGQAYPRVQEPERPLDFTEILDMPDEDHSAVQVLDLTSEESERYIALRSTFFEIISRETQTVNKLFGYPDNTKSCAAFEAERLYSAKPFSQIDIKNSQKWQLLLQISAAAYPFKFFEQFGQGSIFFMIKKSDLQRGNFDDVQVVVQSCN